MPDDSVNHPIFPIKPDDYLNRQLVANVHPPGWKNPHPAERYNLVVVGAGTAGLVSAAVAAALGAKVALVEKNLMGGDCLNIGCVPSKSFIRAARAWSTINTSGDYGISVKDADRDFSAVMERIRRLRLALSGLDSVQRFTNLGVDVFIGHGHFISKKLIQVGDARLPFSRAVICTGARAAAPKIVGLKESGYLTNETIFSLTVCPRRLAVIGAGPIGCELSQAFARFGSTVTLIETEDQILPREDRDAAAIIQAQMKRDGLSFKLGATITSVETQGSEKIIHFHRDGEANAVTVDDIFVSVGRAPNVENLGLREAGVNYDNTGVSVSKTLHTSNSRIFAAGDVCCPYKFTHTADAMAQIVIKNALFPHPLGLGLATTDELIIPWCTYTDPEIAHVGLYESEASKQGFQVETFTQPLDEVDRAVLDGETEGFARVHIKRGTDTILGGTIVAGNAGNIISELTLAMKTRAGLSAIGNTIHPYPTQAEVLRKVANLMRKKRFSQTQKSILKRWFQWTR